MYRSASIVVLALLACKGNNTSSAPVPEPAPKPAAAAPAAPPKPEPKEPSVMEKLEAAADLKQALDLMPGAFADNPDEEENGQVGLLLMSMTIQKRGWSQLQAIGETSFAKVMKDSESEKAKRLCVSGSVIEIARVGPFYKGGIISSGKVVRFVTTGDTGEIVQNSGVRFCGVVVGKVSYENSGGGTTHGVYLSGLFDLPENKKPPAPAASAK
jgi:hypothetical protein